MSQAAKPASLRREDFTEERIAAFAQIAASVGFSVTTPEERERSLRETLSRVAPGEDVWIFGYGSLMWNPALQVQESRLATIHGYHRRFCLDQQFGRGSPDCPGLMLGLDRGGACNGVAHRIAAPDVEPELQILWRREMPSGAYRPTWVTARLETGASVRAVTFVNDRAHPRYVGRLPEAEVVRRVALAAGQSGTNREYLENTVRCLEGLGIEDPSLLRIHRQVAAFRAALPDGQEGGAP